MESVKNIKVSTSTIAKYLEYLIESFMFSEAKRYYIQSALSVSDPDKMTTELRPLKYTKDFFKKIIISKSNAKPWIDEDGIVHIGLYDFC